MVTVTLQVEIQRQIEHNRQRTFVLVLAAVVNATAVALLPSLAVGSPLPALGVLLILAVWIVAVYHTFEGALLRCIAVRPLTVRERYRILPLVERIAMQLDIAPPRLLVQADLTPSALAFGAGARSTVIVTDSLLALVDDDELEGVLAHECAHIANHDTEIAALSAALLGWAVVVTFLVTALAIGVFTWGIAMLTGRDKRERCMGELLAGIIMGLLLITLAAIAWLSIRLWLSICEMTLLAISREREWLADATAARTTGKPLALADALEKVAVVMALPAYGSARTESLTLIGRARWDWWRELLDTHPDIRARIAHLRQFAGVEQQ